MDTHIPVHSVPPTFDDEAYTRVVDPGDPGTAMGLAAYE